MIDGKVIYLSADTIAERGIPAASPRPSQGANSFIVRVKLDEADLQKKIDSFRPSPGMPADAFIETGRNGPFSII